MKFYKLDGSREFGGSELAAVSDDGRAVSWRDDRNSWVPLTPSSDLASKILESDTAIELTGNEAERLLKFRDYPRNFNARFQAEERWRSWVAVGVLMSPIAIWPVWNDFVSAVGIETAVGLVILLQGSMMYLLPSRILWWIGSRAEAAEQRAEGSEDSKKLASRIHPAEQRLTEPLTDSERDAGVEARKLRKARREAKQQSGWAKSRPNVLRRRPKSTTTKGPESLKSQKSKASTALEQLASRMHAAEKLQTEPLTRDEEELVRRALEKLKAERETKSVRSTSKDGEASNFSGPEKISAYRRDLIDKAKVAGLDAKKFSDAIAGMTDEKLRELRQEVGETVKLGYSLDFNAILASADVFETVEGFYVYQGGRLFFLSSDEGFWTQSFDSKIPDKAPLSSPRRLLAAFRDESIFDEEQLVVGLINLSEHSVRGDENVTLSLDLEDGSSTAVTMHAAEWAIICIGAPHIKRDGDSFEWHFNDYAPQVSIYAIESHALEPLRLVCEVNWKDLGRQVSRR